MALKLMYITNNREIAKIAQESHVDWIFVDLETIGKEERQGHLNTVISNHKIEDVKKIKAVLKTSELLVRVNPIHRDSKTEIDRVIEDGADIVMLPFFKTKEEAESFIGYIDKRARTMLLLETPQSVEIIEELLALEAIDYIHIGLNDLHLAYGTKFMFEPLAEGSLEKICRKIEKKGIPYGFGGIAQLGKGELLAEYIIAEHHRLGSSMVILSRSFCNIKEVQSLDQARDIFKKGVSAIKNYEESLKEKDHRFFQANKKKIKIEIEKIRDSKVEADEKSTHNSNSTKPYSTISPRTHKDAKGKWL